MRQREGADFCSLFDAGVPQTPAQWIRQRRGADFFNAGVPQALAKRMRQRAREPSSALSPNAEMDNVRQAELPYYASGLGPNSAPHSTTPHDSHQRTFYKGVATGSYNGAGCQEPKLAPARQ